MSNCALRLAACLAIAGMAAASAGYAAEGDKPNKPEEAVAQVSGLKAGISVMDITPPVGFRLVGHAARNKPSEGVHDPLMLKVLTVSDGKNRIALITADIANVPDSLITAVRQKAKDRLNFDGEHILMNASHTHTGPSMYGGRPASAANPAGGPSGANPDRPLTGAAPDRGPAPADASRNPASPNMGSGGMESYVPFVEDKTVGGIREAMLHEQPVTVRWAEERAQIGIINRRVKTERGWQDEAESRRPR